MARNLKNLVEDYDEDAEEIGGIQRIARHPKFNQSSGYTTDNREIQKRRREKDKMRQAGAKRYEEDDE